MAPTGGTGGLARGFGDGRRFGDAGPALLATCRLSVVPCRRLWGVTLREPGVGAAILHRQQVVTVEGDQCERNAIDADRFTAVVYATGAPRVERKAKPEHTSN